jgi:Mg-chelatase subunit ChlD
VFTAAAGVTVKILFCLVSVLFVLACNNTEFYGESFPSSNVSPGDVLDVSERQGRSQEDIMEDAQTAPQIPWNPIDTKTFGPLKPMPGGLSWLSSLPNGHPEFRPGLNLPTIPIAAGAQWQAMSGGQGFARPAGTVDLSDLTSDRGTEVRPIKRIIENAGTCIEQQNKDFNYLDVEGPRSERIEARLKGEICPRKTANVNVLFVVDFSASMGRHVPEGGGPVQNGNDPLINGQCGRLAAIKTVIEKMKRTVNENTNVRMALIPFAGSVVQPFIVKVMGIHQFDQAATAERLCRYVMQNEQYSAAGALSQSQAGSSSATNYAAAFQASVGALQRARGRNLIYFITDGEPSRPKPDPAAIGIRYAEQLRRSIANLTFNSLILGSKRPEAERVLTAVTGASERVRYVERAEELAEAIAQFSDGTINPNNPKNTGWMYVTPYPARRLGLERFVETGTQEFTYITKPFVLLGIPGQTVSNRIVIESFGRDGSTHQSIVIIRYKQY